MSLIWKERFKFTILLLLIAASLLQVGILWNYQDHGLPTNVFSIFSFDKTQHSSEDFVKNVRDKYFVPYKVVVSEGYDNPRWVINQYNDGYDKLWDEAQFYMKSALLSKPSQYLPVAEWGRLIANRSFVFEFKTNVNKNLLAWFLDISDASSDGPSGVYKMIILPEEDLNYNFNTIYIRDDSRVYKYTIPFSAHMMNRNGYTEMFARFEGDKDMVQYTVLREKYTIASIDQDILGVMKGQGYSRYSSVICTLPEEFKAEKLYSSSDIDKIAEAVLGGEKFGYDRSWDSENTIEFKTLNNIYRIYSDGFLEYRFLSEATSSGRGSMSDAFMRAALFLEKIEPISSNPDVKLFLSKIEELPTYYKFYFDYDIAGVPVIFDYKLRSEDRANMQNAFIIEANGRSVLKGYGVVKKFEKDKESTLYNIKFIDLINDAYKVHGYSEFGNVADITINDISIAYKVGYSTSSQELKPVWIISTPNKTYTIPMREK